MNRTKLFLGLFLLLIIPVVSAADAGVVGYWTDVEEAKHTVLEGTDAPYVITVERTDGGPDIDVTIRDPTRNQAVRTIINEDKPFFDFVHLGTVETAGLGGEDVTIRVEYQNVGDANSQETYSITLQICRDTDGDGVADPDQAEECEEFGEDICPEDPENDADNDGVCEPEDICPEGDDNVDVDNDGTPDACDDCVDVDRDGICDDEDPCPNDAENSCDNPVIGDVPNFFDINEGETVEFEVEAEDPNGRDLNLIALQDCNARNGGFDVGLCLFTNILAIVGGSNNLPDGATFENGSFEWETNFETVRHTEYPGFLGLHETHDIMIIAHADAQNGLDRSETRNVRIIVNDVNQLPTMTAVELNNGPVIVDETNTQLRPLVALQGNTFNFNILGDDLDLDDDEANLEYSIEEAPAGVDDLLRIASNNRFFSWTTAADQEPGVYNVQFKVHDTYMGANGNNPNEVLMDVEMLVCADADQDGVADEECLDEPVDICPEVPNPDQNPEDLDQDGIPDECDDCIDVDGDNVCDNEDNCPLIENPDQADADNNGVGDVCDEDCVGDADEDGVCDNEDNCPLIANEDQVDIDADGIGDACDVCIDVDEDNVCDDVDNCPFVANEDQVDIDEDGIGDACDVCIDVDEDNVCDDVDNCPLIANEDQVDIDEDGIGDACDVCIDVDEDNVCDDVDNCPLIANEDQIDIDADGIGDACDVCIDVDEDLVCDNVDICLVGDDAADQDGDLIPDACDICPLDADNDADGDGVCGNVDICLAGDDNVDQDQDGQPDACDICPADPLNDADGDGVCGNVDICELGDDNVDQDNDLIPDACDICPADPLNDADNDGVCGNVDICELGDDNLDADLDNVPDACDLCQGDDAAGDADNDGICGDIDICPLDPNHVDLNNNNILDCQEPDGLRFISAPEDIMTAGRTYTYDADAIDPQGDPITFILREGPEGMTIDPNTGLLTFEGDDEGSYRVDIEATDGQETARQRYTLRVRRAFKGVELARAYVTPEVTYAGGYVQVHVEVNNEGSVDVDDYRVIAMMPELGVYGSTGEFNLDNKRTEGKTITLPIPYYTYPGYYTVKLIVQDDHFHDTMYREVLVLG